MLDTKFQKPPNFIFKTAKIVERFVSSVKTIRLVTLIVESRLPLCENVLKTVDENVIENSLVIFLKPIYVRSAIKSKA